MKVFKLYLKLIWSHIGVILLYFGIFILLATIFFSSNKTKETGFQNVLVKIAFINDDVDSNLVNGLKDHLGLYANFVDVKKEDIDDAIFFEQINVSIIIPEGFTDDFLNGNNPEINQKTNPNQLTAYITIEQAINKYLNMVNLYQNNTDLEINNILSIVNDDLKAEVEASVLVKSDSELESSSYFFNYFSYVVTALMTMIIGIIMLRFKNINLKRRLESSPYPEFKTTIEMTLGHSFVALIFLITLIVMTALFYPTLIFTTYGLIYIINTLVYIIVGMALGYLIGLVVKTEESLSALSTVVSLGTSFLTGAFVPQNLLGPGLIKFAHLFPSYYYVANNNSISTLTTFTWESQKQIILFMGIQLLFAAVIFGVALIIKKKQSTAEN